MYINEAGQLMLKGNIFFPIFGLELLGLWLYIKLILRLGTEKPKPKKNIIKFDDSNYPFGKGEETDIYRTDRW